MKHFRFVVPEHLSGVRLDQGLHTLIQPQLPLSKSAVRRVLVAGAVYLNKTRVRIASKPLRPGAVIELYYDEKKETKLSGIQKIELTQKDILYEDEDLIALNKPSGLPMMATLDEARFNMVTTVKQLLEKRDNRQGAYLGVHHRLDADTSGVALFTKTKKANAGTAKIFQEHLAVKTYHALCHAKVPPPQDSWAIRNQLLRIHPKKNKYRVGSENEEGSFAYTECRALKRQGGFILIEAKPITGRTHQIRVQLADMGLPVMGDVIYGTKDDSRLMLHARELRFSHPISNKEICITAPFDKEWEDQLYRFLK